LKAEFYSSPFQAPHKFALTTWSGTTENVNDKHSERRGENIKEKPKKSRERERERERQTDRQTDRHRDREFFFVITYNSSELSLI
jgi:hypothetical protein